MSEEKKIRQRKATRKWYVKNRDAALAYAKEYRQRPEVKERHRIKAKEWRAKNHDRFLEISRKSYKNNGEKQNARKRRLLKEDPEFKRKIHEREARYKASGRRKEMHKRRQLAKTQELRDKSAKWKADNPEKVRKYVRWYKDNVWIEHEKNQRDNLDDRYVIKVIKKWTNWTVKTSDIPKELIELTRLQIKTKRKLKTYQL